MGRGGRNRQVLRIMEELDIRYAHALRLVREELTETDRSELTEKEFIARLRMRLERQRMKE